MVGLEGLGVSLLIECDDDLVVAVPELFTAGRLDGLLSVFRDDQAAGAALIYRKICGIGTLFVNLWIFFWLFPV